ncbi:hypothetical protein [Mycolicibacterium celeriflavum]|uniref:Uncharacterized protein n=1 Tax=Mycolicibacterium celeriflavum TaxID=1249101 RepID=A0A1X0BL58_MYCCF|nr:hypothetical protein [Mycolicibacterium celeriflavum]MCV7240448.1 hypothetical protein [Mycolicibacterium celeriflavum]ORA43400.1 hypothetical protein BST21_21830 [Mycolicibacterium celeriflavum]BBY43592.1 hypothetical protein MCEL_18870 [Mycolicibacterium celeriflavum]
MARSGAKRHRLRLRLSVYYFRDYFRSIALFDLRNLSYDDDPLKTVIVAGQAVGLRNIVLDVLMDTNNRLYITRSGRTIGELHSR